MTRLRSVSNTMQEGQKKGQWACKEVRVRQEITGELDRMGQHHTSGVSNRAQVSRKWDKQGKG